MKDEENDFIRRFILIVFLFVEMSPRVQLADENFGFNIS